MNQSETLTTKATFSFSKLKKNVTGVIEKKIFGFEKSQANLSLVQTINNYLKTTEEMDAEFSSEMNAHTLMDIQHTDIFETYGKVTKSRDGNSYAYSPEDIHLEFMEENY